MYAENSPRSARRAVSSHSSGGVQGQNKPPLAPNHHTHGHVPVPIGVRPSTSAGSLLSPGRTRRPRTGSQGSRSDSPLTLPVENMQSANAAYSMSQAYLMENTGSSPSRSPYQSPAHSRSSSMTSVKSLLRDRSLDRGLDRDPREYREREHRMAQRHHERRTPMVRDRSLDRQMDRQRDIRDFDGYHTYGGHKDRSIEREYPHMGARSLERDNHGNLVRSRSIDYEYVANQAAFLPNNPELRHIRDTLILDLQTQIAELNKECACLQQEVDSSKDKLSSSMNSIKTFWSPELKKERALRKEESAKCNQLTEQFRVLQTEKQRYGNAVRDLEQEVKDFKDGRMSSNIAPHELEVLRKEKERQAKEIVLLRRTVEEMELRIETQKQTLGARDESIKKLLEMLQSKGLAVKQLEEDRLETERLNAKIMENDRRIKQLEKLLEQKDRDNHKLKEEILRSNQETRQAQSQCDKAKRESGNIENMQALVESKEARIQALEKEVKILEDEMLRLREEGLSTDKPDTHSSLQVESMRSQEKLSKAKLENVKAEVTRKDSELYALRTQMETLEKQGADHQQHILVLREQITAKEQQTGMLQSDMDLLRERLKEKDAVVEKKAKTVVQAQNDKKRIENEMNDIRDHLDIKDRKINVLQRKIENLEDLVKDKESQLAASQSKLASLHADHHSNDSTVSSLEGSITDKERQIERLKEQRERADREHQEETEIFHQSNRELKARLDALQSQLDEKQHLILELREQVSEVKAEKLHKESAINQMELLLSQKGEEISHLQEQTKKNEDQKTNESQKILAEREKKVTGLQAQLDKSKEEISKVQNEVERLLEILRQMEDEKHSKDKQIKELQEQVKENKQKMGTLKRNQQTEKSKNAQMLEEARKREENVTDDASSFKNIIKDKDERIEELEEALRESVKITAQRELVMEFQERKLQEADLQVKCMVEELEKMRDSSQEDDKKMDDLKLELEAKEKQLKLFQSERNKQLAGVYEMKQEAILAAISEKDAHIALLEMAPNAKTENIEEVGKLTKDKIGLQSQLKELTQSRMKLLQGEDGLNDTALAKKLKNAPRDQVIQAIRTVEHRKKRFQSLIDQLLAVCLEISPDLLEGLPRIQLDHGVRMEYLRRINHQELLEDLREREKDCIKLQDYVNTLLERIKSVQPGMLESILLWLDGAVCR